MKFNPTKCIQWHDFFEETDTGDIVTKSLSVVVLCQYKQDANANVLNALIPAHAFINPLDEHELTVDFSILADGCDIHRRHMYDSKSMPIMYDDSELELLDRLNIGIGFLMQYDEAKHALEPQKQYWWSIWQNDDWYKWSNEQQAYCIKYDGKFPVFGQNVKF